MLKLTTPMKKVDILRERKTRLARIRAAKRKRESQRTRCKSCRFTEKAS